jgi:nitrile hydratase subunit beta
LTVAVAGAIVTTVNGVHDMGGTHGFGPIRPRENDEAFHEAWEHRLHAIVRAARAQGIYNIDESRHGIERMDPAEYLRAGYYERWLSSLERNLVEKGVLTGEEIENRCRGLGADGTREPARREDPALVERVVRAQLTSGGVPRAGPSRFQPGDRVVTRNTHPTGHTRLPRYARGKHGVIDRFHGVDTLPDANAHGLGPCPEPLYSVRFEATELWGDSADPSQSVNIDLWESYLEADEEG